jgi:LPS-assembly lipoprotein
MLWRGLCALASVVCLVALGGCGFALRVDQPLPFDTIAVTPERPGGVSGALTHYLGKRVRPVAPGADGVLPDVIVDILQETRNKVIVSVTTSGQVREYEVHLNVVFRIRTPYGVEVIPHATIERTASISYSETAALAKEAEEAMLYRDMQADVVQQLMRRLALLHMPPKPAPVTASEPAP